VRKQDRCEGEKLKKKDFENSRESLLIDSLLIWQWNSKTCWENSIEDGKISSWKFCLKLTQKPHIYGQEKLAVMVQKLAEMACWSTTQST